MSIQLHLVPLAGFAGLMLTAALEDLRRLLIPNRLTAALCALWPVHLATTPLATAPAAALGCAFLVFCGGALLFARGILGGGDVKLLAAAALWAGPRETLPLILDTGVIGGVLALSLLLPATRRLIGAWGAASLETGDGTALRAPVPYGVAIAAAALFVTIPPYFG